MDLLFDILLMLNTSHTNLTQDFVMMGLLSPSHRGDLEILGYCLLLWSCGRLLWEDHIDDKPKVASLKKRYKDAPNDLIENCFKEEAHPKYLQRYMELIYKLSYDGPLNTRN
uniref:Uncharacterized protein n=1 Tax=Amphimedon queenslandica TaxID=400682 RepID=A0A1X7UNZ1_AMPQE